MQAINENETHRRWRLVLWVLRVTVAIQCLGNWQWLTQIEETPLLHWMLSPADVGGLAWQESTALRVQQFVGWAVLLAGALTLWRPIAWVLAPLVVLQSLITVAMWQLADGYSLQIAGVSPQLLMLFPFATQAARIVAPLGLLMVLGLHGEQVENEKRIERAMQIIRYTIAVVFFAHGIEACQLNPKFLDLLMISTFRLLGLSMTQAFAEQGLIVIGMIDILLAVACLCFRSLPIMGWLAFWGGATAVSRVVVLGWGTWYAAATRFPHFGLPLAVALWWYLLKWNSQAAPTEAERASIDQRTSTDGEKNDPAIT